MTLDLEAFEERAAIIEFCGGATRFQAETEAAKAQGMTRWQALREITNAKRNGNSQSGGDYPAQARRNATDNLPGVQPAPEEQDRPMLERDVQAGRDRVELLALRAQGRGVV